MQKVEKAFVSKTLNSCFSLFSVLKLAEHNKLFLPADGENDSGSGDN